MTRIAIALVLVIAACGKKALDGKPLEPPVKPDTCAVAGATQLKAWPIPQGCSIKDADAPTWLRTDADLAAHVGCGSEVPEFDFPAPPLLAITRTLSPATVGIDAYDDRKTITWVSRQRNPCPNEHPPMPVPMSYVFVASGLTGDRAYAESTCTVTVSQTGCTMTRTG